MFTESKREFVNWLVSERNKLALVSDETGKKSRKDRSDDKIYGTFLRAK